MPLYEYKCESCNFEFEELVINKEGSLLIKCRRCGAGAKRKMSSFSSVVKGSFHESVDMKIGKEADKRWQMYHDRQKVRRSDKNLEKIELPKKGNYYEPVMALGSKEEIKKRNEFSLSLQKHRQERVKRGRNQFNETGSF